MHCKSSVNNMHSKWCDILQWQQSCKNCKICTLRRKRIYTRKDHQSAHTHIQ